ncbi:hypothetical protein AQUCO_00100693v1 [Aquilegia coerulea]|uniref:ELM2 domain-containing protein n=1 Tax=Aquilegia coerulea TaxID=218851 RepID=A0A2G5FBS3_AQUCA|nr:hypothetical protein AQUCO_00100693v1 [Aquilegia coerulea]
MTIDRTFEDESAGGSSTPAENMSPILISNEVIDQAKLSRPHKATKRSIRLVNCTGDKLRKLTIPVGKRFQADIPKWNKALAYDYNLESSKWLGEKIWPIGSGNINTNIEMIGKGRPESSCSCDFPGSIECIKSHIHEERLRLLSEVGDAFYSWGCDKMGEAVSESWTLKEQNNFNKLFGTRTLSYEGFWRRAVKCLPMKQRESIVSFYFNVFVLRNVSRQARLPSPVIDSDDDNK